MSEVVCENLLKVYKTGKVEVVALRDLNLKIRKEEFRAIVGPSGSGKTTLLSIIGGILKPTAGRVIVDGINIVDLPEKRIIEYRRKHVGFVFQFFNLIPSLTAIENVELPMVLVGVPREERKKRAKELLRLVGLEERANHFPSELSGGEQQRVAIAAALANDPPLILADEPTGELDSVTSIKIAELFRQLHKELNKTVIVVTHDIAVARVADRISRIIDGKITETISPAELKEVGPEISMETQTRIVNLEIRKQKLIEEIDRLKRDLAEDLITPDEFVERYLYLKSELEAIEKELSKLKI